MDRRARAAGRLLRTAALVVALAIAAMLGLSPGSPQAGAPGASGPASIAALRDFMIQNVCLDATGAVVEGVSPIDGDRRCVAQRDLRPGENLPYHKHDHPASGAEAQASRGYQRSNSFPVATAAFGTVVEDSFDFGEGDGRRFGVFDAGSGDGGNVILLSSGAASFAMTEDGGGGFQLFVGAKCQGRVDAAALTNSWLIARLDADRSMPLMGQAVARLKDLGEARQANCPARFDAAFTRWRVQPVRYRAADGQGAAVTLTTLISEHYGGARPDSADHVERFYFTRELGATRWERWQNLSRSRDFSAAELTKKAAALAASGRCSKAASPSGGAFVMVDCREWTLIVPAGDAAGDPPGFFIDAARSRHLAAGLLAAPPDRQ